MFLKVCSEIRQISEKDVYPKQSTDTCNVTRSTLLHRIFVALLISKPSKTSVSLTILLSFSSKGLIFHFYPNGKRDISDGWRHTVAGLFTYQSDIGRNAS